jgi:DNA-binding winged helix-turn-helix (wHTH) protein
VEFDVGLDAAIHKLRSALGDSAENPRLVETLPRRGYRFIATAKNGKAIPQPDKADSNGIPSDSPYFGWKVY